MAPSDFAEKPGVKADIGSDCRCGCIVHLTVSRSRRIIAASAQSCPGRTFWLIQADAGHRVRIHFDFFRLICAEQYIRVRDGDSLASDLIGEFVGGNAKASDAIVSTESKLLLEFYSNELSTVGESCKGGFLTHVQQIRKLNCAKQKYWEYTKLVNTITACCQWVAFRRNAFTSVLTSKPN